MPVFITLLALIIIVPIVEISAIVFVGQHIGALPTVLLLLGSALVGSWLLRSEGRRAWAKFRDAIEAGRTPASEAVEGVLVLFGGLLMMLPGFATDIIGLLLVLPPTRRLAARFVLRRVVRRLPPTIATDLLGPVRVRARRGRASQSGTTAPTGVTRPPTPEAPENGRVIEGEIEPGPPQT